MRGLVVILLAGCATSQTVATPKGGPRGLRASEHIDVARQHDELARQQVSWPDAMSSAVSPSGARDMPIAMPSYRSWDTAGEHERLAEIHRGKAAELQAEYEAACGDRAADDIAASPLRRFGTGGWATATGVIVYLTPGAGDPDRLVAAMKCHRAWMMLAPADMDDCPLDIPGLVVDVRGDAEGITVSLTVRDPALVGELQRRAAHELETAGGIHHGDR